MVMEGPEQRRNLIRVANYLSLLAQLADHIGDIEAYEEWDCEAASIALPWVTLADKIHLFRTALGCFIVSLKRE